MANKIVKKSAGHVSPFERIRKINEANNEYWESRDLAKVLEYSQYRNFEAVIEKARLACFNSGHRIEDHFADVSKMIGIGKGGKRMVMIMNIQYSGREKQYPITNSQYPISKVQKGTINDK